MLQSGVIRAASIALALVGTPMVVAAEPVGPTYRIVKSGELAPMGFHFEVGPNCRSLGTVAMNVIEPPKNGEVIVKPKLGHVSLASSSRAATCNNRRIRGTEVFYKSNDGFDGADSYLIERVFPNGSAQKFRINVSVR